MSFSRSCQYSDEMFPKKSLEKLSSFGGEVSMTISQTSYIDFTHTYICSLLRDSQLIDSHGYVELREFSIFANFSSK